MNQTAQERTDMALLRNELRMQESAAKSVPYISFILTHVALVLFLVVSFFIDRIIPNPTGSLIAKVILAVIAVVFLASEWIYSIISSRRWKRNIQILQHFEEGQRLVVEQTEQRRQAEIVNIEQMRNRALKHDLERLREQNRDAIYQQPIPQDAHSAPLPSYSATMGEHTVYAQDPQARPRGREAYKHWKQNSGL